MKEIRKMPLNKVVIPRRVKDWVEQYFRDILERNAISGDIKTMLWEAYVLGYRHSIVGAEHLRSNQIEGKST
jgi:hypothetical protein